MNRYIDAEVLKTTKSIQSADFNSIESIREWIDKQPKADVRENVHGKWLLDGKCSECLVAPLTSHKNFCPNCGADMRGES